MDTDIHSPDAAAAAELAFPDSEWSQQATITAFREAFLLGWVAGAAARPVASEIKVATLREAAGKIARGSERQTRRTVELTLLAEANRVAASVSSDPGSDA